MAGVKGRSGGPRPNSGGARPNSGGRRPGAGRKPKATAKSAANQPETAPPPAIEPPAARKDPLAFLEDVVNDSAAPLKDRIRAAVAAAQYRHTKRGDGGKNEDEADRAQKAASKFAPAAPPRLAAVSGKKV